MYFLFTVSRPLFYFVVIKEVNQQIKDKNEIETAGKYAFYEANFVSNEVVGAVMTTLILVLCIICFVLSICAISLFNNQLNSMKFELSRPPKVITFDGLDFDFDQK